MLPGMRSPGLHFPSTAPEDLHPLSHSPPGLSRLEFALSFLITRRAPETAAAAAVLGPWIYDTQCLFLTPA